MFINKNTQLTMWRVNMIEHKTLAVLPETLNKMDDIIAVTGQTKVSLMKILVANEHKRLNLDKEDEKR